MADLAGVTAEPGALAREFRKLSRIEGLEAQILQVAESEYIPLNLYQVPEIPWDKPFSYQVTFYGRDLTTGRYARTDRWLTFSREMEVGEVLDVAGERFSAGPDYRGSPTVRFDIMQMSVTGAELRAGEW